MFVWDTFLFKRIKRHGYMGIGDFPRSGNQSQGDMRLELLKFLVEGLLEVVLSIITSFGYFHANKKTYYIIPSLMNEFN